MRLFGFTEAQIEQYRKSQEPQHFEVLEANWPALEWFLEVDDLFKTDQCVVIGLDVLAIKADAEMSGRQISPEVYTKLRILGRVATAELNKKGRR